ncbi:hypothetical protein P3L10_008881 [Capsicum annuum]
MAANSLKLFATLSLLFMLLFATEMGVTEGRTCKSNSRLYSGPCFNNNNNRNVNCNFICSRCEGFQAGGCESRNCVCRRSC